MVSISFEKLTLSNGLDVILHQDHSMPLVAVNVWYHVGSKDEQPGKTGFAHLFEHLMFEGSKHHNRGHFEPLQPVGATVNGSTSTDRTNYWENVPPNYLELALWLEADRMGFLLDTLDQKRFDVQRDVVKNERRQSYENRPYGMAGLLLQGAVYPLPHPYHWPTIGSQEDLEAATLEDAQDFFRRFYAPSNASLAIAGDFQPDEAKRLVERYFADLAPGPAISRTGRRDTSLQGHATSTVHDRVLLPRLYLVWPTVPRFDGDEAALSILAAILGDGKSSRLHRTLVHERQIAQSVEVHHAAAEIAGDFAVEVTAAAGHTPEELEEAARSELERLRSQPPEEEEIARVKNRIEWQHFRQLQSVGGFGGRADRLNAFNVFTGDPGALETDLRRYLDVSAEDVQRVAKAFLYSRHVQLTVLPEPSLAPVSWAGIDRTVQPMAAAPPSFAPPVPERQSLSNGLGLMVVEKRGLPVVALGLALQAGAVADPVGRPGLASFTVAMLQEGTKTRSSQQIADEFEFIGVRLNARAGREQVVIATETLTRHWPKALELMADVLQAPTFPEQELLRVKRERLTSLRRVREDATALAERIAPMLVYGPESRYGHPGAGTESAVEAMSRGDLAGYFQGHYGPEDATLIVVGDVSLEEVTQQAEAQFGTWRGSGEGNRSAEVAPSVAASTTTTIYLVDKPGAAQSVIRAGQLGVPRHHSDYYALTLLNHVFGGQFTARLNQNLRQAKGYSYGYRSWIEWHRESSLLVAGGGVQTAVTREAVLETLQELRDIRGGRPITEDEFQAAKDNLLRQYPASFETPSQILDHLAQLVAFALPDDYYRTLSANIEAVSLDEVRGVAEERLDPEGLTLLVVGDRKLVEPGLKEIGVPLLFVDYEGKAEPSPGP